MDIVKDFLGREAMEGDQIVYTMPRYSELKKGVIQKVNPKSISVVGSGVRYSHQFVIL